MTDQEIIQNLKSNHRDTGLKILYKEFPKIKTYILSNGGTQEMAQEIFNDSLLLLIEKVEAPDFKLNAKLTTFLYGINKFLYMNALRKAKKDTSVSWKEGVDLNAEDLSYDEEKEEKLKAIDRILDTITEKCRQLFELFYFKKESMQTIAEKLKFSSVNSAKTQKYKCLEKAIVLSKQL